MFASNFVIADEYLKHLRGRENLKTYAQSATIESGTQMTNYFCSTCGSLMYRVSGRFPGWSVLRLGTVDDFNLAETALRPRIEQYEKDRVAWFGGMDDVQKFQGHMPRRKPSGDVKDERSSEEGKEGALGVASSTKPSSNL